MKKPREEIDVDGSRWTGDGPTYIVFLKSGDATLMIHGEKAEHRALRKKFHPDVTSGGVSLIIRDFLFEDDEDVPRLSESLTVILRSIVRDTSSEEEAKALLKRLCSVVIAARRRVQEPLGGTAHERFRHYVRRLAKELGRAPTKSEIRQAMFPKAPADRLNKNAREVTRLCDENGLSWLPIGRSGRPKKTKRDSQ